MKVKLLKIKMMKAIMKLNMHRRVEIKSAVQSRESFVQHDNQINKKAY